MPADLLSYVAQKRNKEKFNCLIKIKPFLNLNRNVKKIFTHY